MLGIDTDNGVGQWGIQNWGDRPRMLLSQLLQLLLRPRVAPLTASRGERVARRDPGEVRTRDWLRGWMGMGGWMN